DAAVVHFAAAHDRQQHTDVGGVEHGGEIVHQLFGAAVGKRLVHGDDAVVAHAAGRVQRGGHLGRVVGVVVDNDRAVALALDLKAAAGALELGRGALGVGGRQAQRAHAAAHGQGVVDIVAA